VRPLSPSRLLSSSLEKTWPEGPTRSAAVTFSFPLFDRKGGSRDEAGHEFGRSISGHDVAGLSGHSGHGFGRAVVFLWLSGAAFGLLERAKTVGWR